MVRHWRWIVHVLAQALQMMTDTETRAKARAETEAETRAKTEANLMKTPCQSQACGQQEDVSQLTCFARRPAGVLRAGLPAGRGGSAKGRSSPRA